MKQHGEIRWDGGFDLWSEGGGGTSRSQAVNKATDFDARTS